jgi:hypothetical protein
MIFFSLLLAIFIIIIFYKLYNIQFLTKIETITCLKNDSDNYFKNFSKCDKQARSINNIDEYINKIIVNDFTLKQKLKIYICILKANNFFKTFFKINNYNLDNKTLLNDKWNIALTSHRTYENGFPHTRNNIIFLSDECINKNYDKLTSILIHEKIHVDQKLHKYKYNDIIINNMKLQKSTLKRKNLNCRSNPDVDDIIYVDEKKNITYLAQYNNCDEINNVSVYNNDVKFEHPYEEIAYNIEKLYLSV